MLPLSLYICSHHLLLAVELYLKKINLVKFLQEFFCKPVCHWVPSRWAFSSFEFYLESTNHSFSVQVWIQVEAFQSLARPEEERNYLGGCTYHNYFVPNFFGLQFCLLEFEFYKEHTPLKRLNICSRLVLQNCNLLERNI